MSLLAPPTLAGYTAFLRTEAGINTTVLPDNAFSITNSFTIAEKIVSCWLNIIDCDIYTLAVYNLATDRLLNFAQDQPGETFFANARMSYGLNSFVAGVIESTHDESTGESIAVPDSLRNLQIGDLQSLKTPYGRTYLSFAQNLGTLWGLS